MIYKFGLLIGRGTTLIMPKDSIVRYVGEQANQLCIWVEMGVEDNATFNYDVIGTGWDIAEPYIQYIGTAQIQQFVWHVYQV